MKKEREMSRRRFLKIAGFTAANVLLGGSLVEGTRATLDYSDSHFYNSMRKKNQGTNSELFYQNQAINALARGDKKRNKFYLLTLSGIAFAFIASAKKND